jgi:lanosterol synthase
MQVHPALPDTPDVSVIGAGPVGCVTAIAHAQRGARVVLLEASSELPTRLAGEWIHPTGTQVLEELRIEMPSKRSIPVAGRGFVVFPEDGASPIALDYPELGRGYAARHSDIVGALRSAARDHPNIRFVSEAKVHFLEERGLEVEVKGRAGSNTLTSGRIVGADGRSSVTRKRLGVRPNSLLLSYMAGVLLEDIELPFEGFGHIFLGGIGPALAYRVSDRHVRLCLDVPVHHVKVRKKAAYLWDTFGPVLPPSLQGAFHRALIERPVEWAANRLTPRREFGREGIALVGDAVGHHHPLTALGMTLGFLDARCLAGTETVEEYQRLRLAEGKVPELLANALYETLTFYDDETVAVRRAVFELWRNDPRERQRTMQLLSGEVTDMLTFGVAFCKVLGLAARSIVASPSGPGDRHHKRKVVGNLFGRLGWLASEAIPPDSRLHAVGNRFVGRTLDEPEQQLLFFRARRPITEPVGRIRRRLEPRSGIDSTDSLRSATDAILRLQEEDGRWEGEVVWSPMLAAQYVIAHYLVGRPLAEDRQRAILRSFEQTRLEGGAWGMHGRSEPYLFVTILVYVAARILGQPRDSELLARALAFIREEGGAIETPTWGKFWLAMLNLYDWRGVGPVVPELWSLPRWLQIHPRHLYCHTRIIYAAMAVIYAAKHQAAHSFFIEELRTELYPEGYDAAPFRRAMTQVRSAEVVAPPSPWVKLGYRLLRTFDNHHPRRFRQQVVGQLLQSIRATLRSTGHRSISPVSGLLEIIALWIHDPQDADLRRAMNEVDAWSWEDDEGFRLAGARSEVWDTAFSIQALEAIPDPDARPAVHTALHRARDFLRAQQVREPLSGAEAEERLDPRGGFCFSPAWHGWPVSDCTAEAIEALVDDHPDGVRSADLLEAARFILRCQNPDGGFGSFERRRGRWTLEWLNPAEIFGNSMTERSYVECTASAIAGLTRVQRSATLQLEARLNPAIDRAVAWLYHQQRPSGAWEGAWGVHFIYGTWFGIRGLRAAGVAPGDAAIRKACSWLIERQRSDGGWGEHWRSCIEGRYVEHRESQVIQTAWALIALLQARTPEWGAIERGAEFLVRSQGSEGHWPEQDPAGVFFQSAILDYRLYRSYFPLWALALYEGRRRERCWVGPAFGNGRREDADAHQLGLPRRDPDLSVHDLRAADDMHDSLHR